MPANDPTPEAIKAELDRQQPPSVPNPLVQKLTVLQEQYRAAITEAVRTAPVSYKDILELLGPDGGKVFQAEVDRRVTDAIKKVTARLETERPDTSALSQRLAQLQAAHAAAERANDLRFYVFRRCAATSVPYELVEDIAFPDAAAADKKIAQIAAMREELGIRQVNELLAGSHKPGAGSGPRPTMTPEAFARLPADQQEALERSGELDRIIVKAAR